MTNVHYRKSRKIVGGFDGDKARFVSAYNRTFNQDSLTGSPLKNPSTFLNDMASKSRMRPSLKNKNQHKDLFAKFEQEQQQLTDR